LFASTIAINGGRYDEAISHLRLVRDEDPDNDHALYMLAVAHAQRGEHVEAVAHLLRAIAVNPENRSLAKHDPDLEPLRTDESFRSALETTRLPRGERRRSPRTRPGDRRYRRSVCGKTGARLIRVTRAADIVRAHYAIKPRLGTLPIRRLARRR
jgi:tetratricopeptide (TPR) repeat protein